MKLAIIRQRYTSFGGAERFLERVLASLQIDHLDVTVIARDWPKDAQSGYRRILLKPFSIGRTWRDAAFARAACEVVATGGFDLIQSHERLACCDIFRAGDGVHREWLAQRIRRRGKSTAWLDRASPFHRRILAAERSMFANPRLKTVICNSRMVRDEIIHHYGVAQERLVVIPNAVDGNHFHPGLRELHRAEMRRKLGIDERQPLFLFVGSGFERKGVDLLLDVWPEVDASLVIVGHDRDLANYRQRANKRTQQVHFVGPQQDVRPWYGAADTFVLPTLYDPLPNAALEALSCGLPVLTSQKSGAAEWIQAGVNGDVVDALDQPGWLAVLNSWCDQERCRSASSRARKAVYGLTPDTMQAQFHDLYTHLLSRAS